MFGLGMSEIIFLAILALVVVGPKELPQLARTLGRFLNELKRSSNILTDEIKQQTRLDRFDLDSAMSRRDQAREEQTQSDQHHHHSHHGHHESHAPTSEEPQQMELTESTNDDSDEKKKS
jgi:sec-independent protein translocase protein TatB